MSRTVMITGAAGHLGRAAAEAFEALGDNLVLLGRRESLERAYRTDTSSRMLADADLLDAAAVHAQVDAAVKRYGTLDVLCNLAGGFRMGTPVHRTSDDDWRFLHDVNVTTMRNAVRAVVPTMITQGRGKIVSVGAASAQKGVANMDAYIASKAEVIRLTETMAAELRDHGINVNCVLPTTLDTPDNRAVMPDANFAKWVALGDLASVIVFLASVEARAIHGAALPVTGLS
ncbi:MAG TPA: SDR family NAD(P)-dependent oxidoreductase [Casimicrobiaceae bacterium]|nr:SDR family NAD(P)-dependent oxidoreductase [Casimicrobiaceae bacterium]